VRQLVEIDSDQGFAIAGVRARQAVALDDGARALGRDFKALADLRVSELLEHSAGHTRADGTPLLLPVPVTGHQADGRVSADG
jgi:hypothetical protein